MGKLRFLLRCLQYTRLTASSVLVDQLYVNIDNIVTELDTNRPCIIHGEDGRDHGCCPSLPPKTPSIRDTLLHQGAGHIIARTYPSRTREGKPTSRTFHTFLSPTQTNRGKPHTADFVPTEYSSKTKTTACNRSRYERSSCLRKARGQSFITEPELSVRQDCYGWFLSWHLIPHMMCRISKINKVFVLIESCERGDLKSSV